MKTNKKVMEISLMKVSVPSAMSTVNQYGFALMEIILMLVIIGIIGANIIALQKSSLKSSDLSNHMLVAGQMIEKQIEALRMLIATDPDNNFPPNDSTITENGITLDWKLSSVNRIEDTAKTLDHVRVCELTASWGRGIRDSLKVTTYIAKYF